MSAEQHVSALAHPARTSRAKRRIGVCHETRILTCLNRLSNRCIAAGYGLLQLGRVATSTSRCTGGGASVQHLRARAGVALMLAPSGWYGKDVNTGDTL